MDTSKNGAAIIKRILGNRNNLLIIALLGAVLLILAMPTKQEESSLSYGGENEKEEAAEEVEERLERILKDTQGVGRVRVMITRKGEEKDSMGNEKEECDVEGVVVVAEGAEDALVKKKIQDIVLALFPIEAHKIEIVKMEAE